MVWWETAVCSILSYYCYGQITDTVGKKHYLIFCWFCMFAWQRNDQSIILMVGPVWSLPMNIWMIQRRTGWKCCGQMSYRAIVPKSSYLESAQLAVFGGGGMLSMTPRTPFPPSNTEVETLCFGGVSLKRGQDNCTTSKGWWMAM